MAEKVQMQGERVLQLRKSLDLTQEELEQESGVDRSLISRIERGIRTNVYIETAGRLAQSLRTTSDYLLGLTATPFPPDQSTIPDTELEWRLLEQFRKLDEDLQQLTIDQLDLLVDHRDRWQR